MKSLLILLACSLSALAGKHQFYITPFSQIELTTDKGREKVEIVMGDKFKEEAIYKAKLTAKGKGVYESADGVIFTVTKLAKPEVINPGLRWEFKSRCKVVITGSGKSYDKIFKELSFGGPETTVLDFYEEGEE